METTEITKSARLAELGHDETKALGARLLDICRLIGIQEPPADILALLGFVKKYYPTLTIDQVSEAFLLNSAGRLIQKYEPYYSSFDVTFIGNVLNSYTETKRLERLSKPAPEALPVEKQLENTVPKHVADLRLLLALLEVVRRTKAIPTVYAWLEVYAALYKKGRVTWPSPEYKAAFIKKVEARFKTETAARAEAGFITTKDLENIIGDPKGLDYQLRKAYVREIYLPKLITPKQ